VSVGALAELSEKPSAPHGANATPPMLPAGSGTVRARRLAMSSSFSRFRRARFVHDIGDETAVLGDVEGVDVPFFGRSLRRELARRRIERAEPLEIAAFVAGHPDRAVGGKSSAAKRDGLAVVADRRHRAADQIEAEQVGFLHRRIFADQRPTLVRREIEQAPAAALYLRHHPARLRVAWVHHINIAVAPVAQRRGKGNELAVLAPGVEPIAALAIGEQVEAPVLHRIDLIEFIAADVLLDQHHIGLFWRPTARPDRLGLEGDLLARAHRHRDAVQLHSVAEASRDQHRFVDRVPADKTRPTIFHIGPCRRRQVGRHFGHAVGDQRRRFGFDRRLVALGRRSSGKRQGQGGEKGQIAHDDFPRVA
jgi:hypothetical protein